MTANSKSKRSILISTPGARHDFYQNNIRCTSHWHWLHLNQQGALVRKDSGTQNFWNFVLWRGIKWCNVNFCIPLFSVLLTCRSCNVGVLLFRHWRNQRNIYLFILYFASVKITIKKPQLKLGLLILNKWNINNTKI